MVLCGSAWPSPARYRFIASNLEIKLKGACLDLQHTYRNKYLHIGANMSETGQEPKRRSEHPTQSVKRLSQHASSDVKQAATSAQHAHGTPRGTRHSAMLVWIPQPEATSSVESADDFTIHRNQRRPNLLLQDCASSLCWPFKQRATQSASLLVRCQLHARKDEMRSLVATWHDCTVCAACLLFWRNPTESNNTDKHGAVMDTNGISGKWVGGFQGTNGPWK